MRKHRAKAKKYDTKRKLAAAATPGATKR